MSSGSRCRTRPVAAAIVGAVLGGFWRGRAALLHFPDVPFVPLRGLVDAASIARYRGQIVELAFADGARVRAHLISVDPDVLENHVIYDVLHVIAGADSPDAWKHTPLATSAPEIFDLRPTDGKGYLKAPGSKSFEKPWWRFW
jgi:hypothetical protein